MQKQSPIEYSIGERLQERFYAVGDKIWLHRIEFEFSQLKNFE